jgi:hypothetical protein
MGTLTLIRDRRYARLMSELPTPVKSMTLAEIQADHEQVYNLLEQGGVIRVYTEGEDHFLGVLTRDRTVLDSADIGMLVQNGHIPALDELERMADRGEIPSFGS